MMPFTKKQWTFLIAYPFLHYVICFIIFAFFTIVGPETNWAEQMLRYLWFMMQFNTDAPMVHILAFSSGIVYGLAFLLIYKITKSR